MNVYQTAMDIFRKRLQTENEDLLRDMAEAKKNDPNYGVANQETIRKLWKSLTGEEIKN